MIGASTRYTEHYHEVMKALTSRGLLLAAYDASAKPNLMTIGWGSIGSIWGMPIWTVLVRPSRYTYQCIEHSGCFTVNVPTEAMAMACSACGAKSGRDSDKFAQAGLTSRQASVVKAPEVVECPIVYQCQVVHANDVMPAKLVGSIAEGSYAGEDYHRIYYGKILAMRVDADASLRLGG